MMSFGEWEAIDLATPGQVKILVESCGYTEERAAKLPKTIATNVIGTSFERANRARRKAKAKKCLQKR